MKLVLGAFALVVLFVNPVRETALEDDWAYALTVRHLLATGDYRLHDWAAANMPFQAYWGSLFVRAAGYSFSSLRISTLVLALLGLIAFFHLAKEHGLDHDIASLLALGLFASPLVLRFSFNFMTDVPFLACLIIALALYTKAIRRCSYSLMVVASVAASAAILTRQFGVALLGGVFALWTLDEKRWQRIPFFFSGAALPLVAAGWQLWAGLLRPNVVAAFLQRQQRQYFVDSGTMLANVLWRPSVVLQYLALFSVPLVLLALPALASEAKQRRARAPQGRSFNAILLGSCAVYILAGVFYGHYAEHLPWFMPYLPWNFNFLKRLTNFERGLVSVVTATGAIVLARISVLRYVDRQAWSELPAHRRLLDLTTFFLLAMQLVFVQFGDEYLLGFLPFTFIVVGHHLRTWLTRFRTATTVGFLLALVVSAMGTRGVLVLAEAQWTGAELVRASGVQPNQIFGSFAWNCYYGSFQDYLMDIGDPSRFDVGDFVNRWLPERKQRAQFLIVDSLDSLAAPPGEKRRIVTEIPYRGIRLEHKILYVVERNHGPA